MLCVGNQKRLFELETEDNMHYMSYSCIRPTHLVNIHLCLLPLSMACTNIQQTIMIQHSVAPLDDGLVFGVLCDVADPH